MIEKQLDSNAFVEQEITKDWREIIKHHWETSK